MDNDKVSIITSEEGMTIIGLKTPASIIDGCVSAFSNVMLSTGIASTLMITTPYHKYQMGGVRGLIEGILKGSMGSVIVLMVGVCMGTVQCMRGLYNTPEACKNMWDGKMWDDSLAKWVDYDMSKEIEELKNMEACYRSIIKPINLKYYNILGIENPMEANQSVIKRAYHKKAREKHPDKGGLGETGAFQEIGEAYHILMNPYKREYYDKYGKIEDRKEIDRIQEVIFGNESVKEIVGELYILMMLNTTSQEMMEWKQRNRCMEIREVIFKLMDYQIEEEQGTVHHRASKLKEWVKEGRKSVLGEEILSVIGQVLGESTTIGIKSAEELYKNYRLLWNIVDMVRLMEKMEGEKGDELGEEEEYDMVNIRREYKQDMGKIMSEMVWYMIIEDVKVKIRSVKRGILYEKGISEEEGRERRGMLSRLGEYLISKKRESSEIERELMVVMR
jgi:curved DNA-binding protein CbpA